MMIYMQSRPFRLADDPYFWDILNELNEDYTPPTWQDIAGKILQDSYLMIKNQVDCEIALEQHINIVMDESTNIQFNRIMNVSVSTDRGVFHWKSRDIGARNMTAESCAEFITEELWLMTKNNLSRINSMSTDTCATMRKTWRVLKNYSELKHVFFIPCNSHGLQLAMKDLLQKHKKRPLTEIQHTFNQALAIVTNFWKAPKQLALLRAKQLEIYKKQIALIASVITHWGTQYSLLKSVENNMRALRAYAIDSKAKNMKKWQIEAAWIDVLAVIQDQGFWNQLNDLIDILKPLHEAQKMSESMDAHLEHVVARWLHIEQHFKVINNCFTNEIEIFHKNL